MKSYFSVFLNKDVITELYQLGKKLLDYTVILVIYIVGKKLLFRLGSVTISDYNNSLLFFESLSKIQSIKYLAIFSILIFGAVLFRKKITLSWKHIDRGYLVRNFVLLLTAILVWINTTQDHNFYFDKSYIIDRLLLIVCLCCVFWKPFFLIPFLFILFPLLGQVEVLDGFTASLYAMPVDLIILFLCIFYYDVFTKKITFKDYVFLFLCYVASNYVISGVGKLLLEGWLFNNHVTYLIPNSFSNGWWQFLTTVSLHELFLKLDDFSVFFTLFTVFIECGFLFVFSHRKAFRIFFIGALVMHFGIFIFSGILFWIWMLVLLGMFFLIRKGSYDNRSFFNLKNFTLSLIIIITGKWWIAPYSKVWFDSPINYTYRFKATLDNNESVYLPPDFFSPYDLQFSFGDFKFLNPSPVLSITWGVHNSSKIHSYFLETRTSQEILQFETTQGVKYVDSRKTKKLHQFIEQYVRNWNKCDLESRKKSLALKYPRLIWTFPQKNDLDFNHKIKTIEIEELMTYFSKERGYEIIRLNKLSRVEIPF